MNQTPQKAAGLGAAARAFDEAPAPVTTGREPSTPTPPSEPAPKAARAKAYAGKQAVMTYLDPDLHVDLKNYLANRQRQGDRVSLVQFIEMAVETFYGLELEAAQASVFDAREGAIRDRALARTRAYVSRIQSLQNLPTAADN